jgi:hypothetical protein
MACKTRRRQKTPGFYDVEGSVCPRRLSDDSPYKLRFCLIGIYHTDFFNIFNLKYLKVFYTLGNVIMETKPPRPNPWLTPDDTKGICER